MVRDIPSKVTLSRDFKGTWESGKSVPSRGNSKGPEGGPHEFKGWRTVVWGKRRSGEGILAMVEAAART